MARQLNISDNESVMTVYDVGPGPIVARIQAIDSVDLTRSDVRTLIAFLEALDV